MLGIIIALVSGALMSVQGVFNTGVTKQTSLWVATAFVQITAFVVCILAWYFIGREASFSSVSVFFFGILPLLSIIFFS